MLKTILALFNLQIIPSKKESKASNIPAGYKVYRSEDLPKNDLEKLYAAIDSERDEMYNRSRRANDTKIQADIDLAKKHGGMCACQHCITVWIEHDVCGGRFV